VPDDARPSLRGLLAAPQMAAAYSLGIAPTTLTVHLTLARRKLGCETTEQAVYLLTLSGKLVVPGAGIGA
jgi:hypothetical protein